LDLLFQQKKNWKILKIEHLEWFTFTRSGRCIIAVKLYLKQDSKLTFETLGKVISVKPMEYTKGAVGSERYVE
jgi:uncharacterized protein (DUF488 family)